MKQKLCMAAATIMGVVLLDALPAKSASGDFYKGKTIRIIVGLPQEEASTRTPGLLGDI